MRLIDAELFEKQVAAVAIKNGYTPEKAGALCELISNQPTAYNMDKVVEQLEEIKRMMESNISPDCFREECIEADCTVCLAGKVIEIVKDGGMNERNSF